MKTFGRSLFGKLSTWIFKSITMSPWGSDPVTVSVTEIAGLGLHKISYKKLLGGFNSLLFHLEDYIYSFISFTCCATAHLEAM